MTISLKEDDRAKVHKNKRQKNPKKMVKSPLSVNNTNGQQSQNNSTQNTHNNTTIAYPCGSSRPEKAIVRAIFS